MKQLLKSMRSYEKVQLAVPATIALNLMLMLSFLLVIVSAIQFLNK